MGKQWESSPEIKKEAARWQAKNFKELQAKMSPAAGRAKSEALAGADFAQMALDELREARELQLKHN